MKTQFDPEETNLRGQQLFNSRIEPLLTERNPGDFVAIDVLSGEYEVNPNDMAAEDVLMTRCPEAVLFVRRVGTHEANFVGKGYRP